jgi:hypothetical protein
MKKLFLAIACWDTIVAIVNIFILPRFLAAEVITYTAASQILPIVIPLLLWVAINCKKQIGWFVDGIIKAIASDTRRMGLGVAPWT